MDLARLFELAAPYLVAAFALLAPFIFGGVLWKLTKTFKPREEIEAADASIENKLDQLLGKFDIVDQDLRSFGSRLDVLEKLEEGEPSRHELSRELSSVKERIAAVETGVKSNDQQLATANRYLEALINREGSR